MAGGRRIGKSAGAHADDPTKWFMAQHEWFMAQHALGRSLGRIRRDGRRPQRPAEVLQGHAPKLGPLLKLLHALEAPALHWSQRAPRPGVGPDERPRGGALEDVQVVGGLNLGQELALEPSLGGEGQGKARADFVELPVENHRRPRMGLPQAHHLRELVDRPAVFTIGRAVFKVVDVEAQFP